MHLWTIFSSIILLAMANEIIGGGGRRDDKIAREIQFSTGHSSKDSLERKVENTVEGAIDLVKKLPKAAKKKAVSIAKGAKKAVEQVVTKRGDYTREYKKNLRELQYISSDVYFNKLNGMRAQTKKIIKGFKGYSKHFKNIKGAVDQLKVNKKHKGYIYYSIMELFLNENMKVEENDEEFQDIVEAISKYHKDEESLYQQIVDENNGTLISCDSVSPQRLPQMEEHRTDMKNIRGEYRKYFASVYYGSKITGSGIIKLVFSNDFDYEDDYVDNTSSRERKSSNDTMNKFKQALKGVPPETTVELENIKTNIDPLWKDIKEKHNRIIRFYKNAKEATINRCVKIKNFAWEINKYKQEKERESSSTDLFVPITTPEVEKMNKAFNQIKLKPAIIYLIYLYEQKRNKKDLKKYEDKINKLRGLAGNIQNFNLQFYEQQNLQALQKYIHINWSIKVVEEEKYKSYHFYNELLKIKFYFHWPTFTFKQSIHDPSYKPTPLGSGAQSFAESSRPSTSMQRSGRDSGHIIATPEEEEEGDDEEDEGEEEYDEEEDEEEDQPETAATAFRQDEGHGEIQPEGHQLGWQGGYPPQWTGQNIPWNHPYDASQFYAPQWTGQFDDHGRPIYYAYPGESSHQLGWQGHDPSHQLGWQGMESYTLKQDEQI